MFEAINLINITISMGIQLRNVSFKWGDDLDETVLEDISFNIEREEFVSFVGPSGCGKSTLLNLVSGLLKPTSGDILIDNDKVLEPNKELGFVFQDYSLFPWLNVFNNVAFGLKINKIPKKEIALEVEDILRKVGLWKSKKKYPHELSGGMQQRTAIARVLANHSDYVLMDEPFGALDYQTRLDMQLFLLSIWKDFKKTILFVTHNVEESIMLSDRVFLFSLGQTKKVKEININIDRPRDYHSMEFSKYRKEIIDHLQINQINQ